MHSVTSGAVATAFEWEDISNKVTITYDTNSSTTNVISVSLLYCYKCKNLIKLSVSMTASETVPAPSGNGNIRFYIQIDGIEAQTFSTISTVSYLEKRVFPISINFNSSITPNGWRVTVRYNEDISANNGFSFHTILPC